MIATKKAKLIRKHLGVNTPEWIVKNCIALLTEYEEIEWCGVPEEQANDAKKSDEECTLPVVVFSKAELSCATCAHYDPENFAICCTCFARDKHELAT